MPFREPTEGGYSSAVRFERLNAVTLRYGLTGRFRFIRAKNI